MGKTNFGKKRFEVFQDEILELQSNNRVPSLKRFKWRFPIQSFHYLLCRRLNIFEIEAQIVVADSITDRSREIISRRGIKGDFPPQKSGQLEIFDCSVQTTTTLLFQSTADFTDAFRPLYKSGNNIAVGFSTAGENIVEDLTELIEKDASGPKA